MRFVPDDENESDTDTKESDSETPAVNSSKFTHSTNFEEYTILHRKLVVYIIFKLIHICMINERINSTNVL